MTVHSASRTILATPRAIFRAMTDPETIPRWRAPSGMTLQISAFEGRTGGQYRMVLTYDDLASATPKSTDRADIVEGSFIELVPDSQIIEDVRFETSNRTLRARCESRRRSNH